ncbi:MAG: DUF115 domain-containing protein [Phycisphaerales bacterium]|nr:DUF115 domain-containing protein [Phycisphaerales bacterium]
MSTQRGMPGAEGLKGASALTALATSVLEKNLAALARVSADAARAIQAAHPRADLRFFETDDRVPGADAGSGLDVRALASRRRPLEEARRLAASIDLTDAAVFIVSGFGLGYHVEALARRVGKTGIVVVFEPDVSLLRAVFERIDCSAWLAGLNVAIVTSADDPGLISRIVDGAEGLVAMGVTLVEHPASRARIGDSARVFHQRFVDIVRAVRMTVVTTMVQVGVTLRNLTQNLDRYALCPGIDDLKDCCAGAPAIVVSAGPSLARNIELLAQPGIRERFLIVAVQTVLKPLLARGIRPHLVTALDHSEISARFYEGLSAEDLEGVTLVVDPKVNPAVLDAWPAGAALRVQSDKYLDRLLGPELVKHRGGGRGGTLKPGATVAHLAYYVARHCGCDPVALVGQDLGFTDGQYYSAGASIHNVWACEINEFNTLEMLEWQRIMRMGQHLRRAVDVLGRPIYTDEQMATYLVQFERDFREDSEHGLRTVDATEGGVRKRHTEASSLRDFVLKNRDRASRDVRVPACGAGDSPAVSLRRVDQRTAEVRAGAFRVAEISRKTDLVLAEIHEHQKDQQRVNRLITRTEDLNAEVARHEPALSLCHVLNQTGSFNRVRADRAIQLEAADGRLDPLERQRRQVERDRQNMRSLASSADALGRLLDDALAMLRGGARVTRDRAVTPAPTSNGRDASDPERTHVRVAAILPVFADRVELAEPMLDGRNVIETTIAHLAACRSIGLAPYGVTEPADPAAARGIARIIVLTDNPDCVRRWIRAVPDGLKIEFVRSATGAGGDPGPFGSRRTAVRAARILSGECWRGGVANLSIFDEVFEPVSLAQCMREAAPPIDAALLVGPDWCAVDPALCDSVVARFRADPARNRFAFTQAAPGLCGCIAARSLVESLAAAAQSETSGAFASIGGILGYIPASPQMDPANMPECITVDPARRDLGVRLVADSNAGRERIRRYTAAVRGEPDGADHAPRAACHLVLELVRGWNRLAAETARAHLEELADACDQGVVTFRGGDILAGDDPLSHHDARVLAQHARQLGLGVHIRTPLTSQADATWLVDDPAADIVSIDLLAHSQDAYHALTGRGPDFVRIRDRLESLLARRARPLDPSEPPSGGDPISAAWRTPWIVPRITRCDAVYAEIEPFHREWLLRCGWAVIDPLPEPRSGERIAPLPVPEWVRRKLDSATRIARP